MFLSTIIITTILAKIVSASLVDSSFCSLVASTTSSSDYSLDYSNSESRSFDSNSEPSCSFYSTSSSSCVCPSESSSTSSSSSSFSWNDCSSSSSSSCNSSSSVCDPCCLGVEKLTYQVTSRPFDYMDQVIQKFNSIDLFGPDACEFVLHLAITLGVNAILIDSKGRDICPFGLKTTQEAITKAGDGLYETAKAASDALAAAVSSNLSNPASSFLPDIETALKAMSDLDFAVKRMKQYGSNAKLTKNINKYYSSTRAAVVKLDKYKQTARKPGTTGLDLVRIGQSSPTSTEIKADITAANTVLPGNVDGSIITPFGTYYDVSRAWSLNRVIYSLNGGFLSAATPLYSCLDEVRALFIYKPVFEVESFLVKNYCSKPCVFNCNN